MKKRPALAVLYRYREHLLNQEQIQLQLRLNEERQEQKRLIKVEGQLRELHATKLQAQTVGEMLKMDSSATFLQARKLQVSRSLALARLAQEEAMANTLKAKQGRDQMGTLWENHRRALLEKQAEEERRELDDLGASRYCLFNAVSTS